MAKKKITKAAKRWRKERDVTRVGKDGDKMWDILKGKNGRENITLFTDDERKHYFAKPQAIGTIQCPLCAKPKVLVANKDGDKGKPEGDYFMRHNGAKSVMCDASLVPVQNLFKEKLQSVVSTNTRSPIMAKHKAGKKPTKKAGGQLVTPSVPEVFPERKCVTPLSAEEKGQWSEMVIGRAICPQCHQLMKVLNDDGLSGDPLYDYIENHPGVGPNRVNLCIKSENLIPNLFPEA